MTDRDDPNKKFRSTQMTFDDLGAALEEIIEELTQLLEPESDCLSCGHCDAECPDCDEGEGNEEGETDV